MIPLSSTEIESLVDNQVRERRDVDFKLALPGRTDLEKKEFVTDVSSFANAAGGELLYGVQEEGGVAVAMPGVSCDNVDAEIGRLENLLRDGIQPRVVGVDIRPVSLTSGVTILAVHVPRSWIAPHAVTLGGTFRFFSRNSNGKYPLDVHELRRAFTASHEITERVRAFRVERLGRMVAGELPVPIGDGPYVVLHIVPYGALAGTLNVVSPVKQGQMNDLEPMSSHGWNQRFNFDGYLTWFVPDDAELGLGSYVQLFRDGRIECVDRGMLSRPQNSQAGGGRWIPGARFESEIIKALTKSCSVLAALGSEPPLAVLLTLVGVSGYRMAAGGGLGGRPVERADLLVPELTIETFAFDAGRELRPAIDAVWNACGFAQSPNYDATGDWRPPR